MLPGPTNRTANPYDVVQIHINGEWKDYATLRTRQDLHDAKQLVERDTQHEYRIRKRNGESIPVRNAMWGGDK